MEQSGTHLAPVGELVAKQVDRPVVHGPSNSIIIACPRQDPLGTLPNEHPGLVGKLANAIFNLFGFHLGGQTLADKQRD